MTIYGPLLLAVLGVFGAGRYSLDRLIIDWAHRALPADASAPHVVIVGAGFGGMACAAGLRHERARVTLIDRHNYHLFQPLLYQVATAALSPLILRRRSAASSVTTEDCESCAAPSPQWTSLPAD